MRAPKFDPNAASSEEETQSVLPAKLSSRKKIAQSPPVQSESHDDEFGEHDNQPSDEDSSKEVDDGEDDEQVEEQEDFTGLSKKALNAMFENEVRLGQFDRL